MCPAFALISDALINILVHKDMHLLLSPEGLSPGIEPLPGSHYTPLKLLMHIPNSLPKLEPTDRTFSSTGPATTSLPASTLPSKYHFLNTSVPILNIWSLTQICFSNQVRVLPEYEPTHAHSAAKMRAGLFKVCLPEAKASSAVF